MRLLLLDKYYPGLFKSLVTFLENSRHEVVFFSEYRRKEFCAAVQHSCVRFPSVSLNFPHCAEAERVLLTLQRRGEAFAKAMLQIKAKGFEPDMVLSAAGHGCDSYVDSVFPRAVPFCALEWFHAQPKPGQRMVNLFQLNSLVQSRAGLCPTAWQRASYPQALHQHIHVLPQGMDIEFFCPTPGLKRTGQLITFMARSLSVQNGFPAILRALPAVLQAAPACHVLMVTRMEGRSEGQFWKEWAISRSMEATAADDNKALAAALHSQRVHVMDLVLYEEYRELLRRSSLHLFCTDHSLPESLLEALACGALVLAADTPPARELLRHKENGLLCHFDQPEALAKAIVAALGASEAEVKALRQAARNTVVEQYNHAHCLPRYVAFLEQACAG